MPIVLKKILFLGIGGFAGSNARYWISMLMFKNFGSKFPFGTLLVNITGCFLLGLIAGGPYFSRTLSTEVKIMISTGFLGALTTFSTFSFETVELFQKSGPATALINLASNLLIGFLAAWGGIVLSQKIA